MASGALEQPLDMIKFHLDDVVTVKLKGERTIHGRLHAYDQHMNMVLGEVEEHRRILETIAEETLENGRQMEWREEVKKRGMLFVRGDAVILVTPKSNT